MWGYAVWRLRRYSRELLHDQLNLDLRNQEVVAFPLPLLREYLEAFVHVWRPGQRV